MADVRSSWLLAVYGLLAVLGGVLGGILSAPLWQWHMLGQLREVRPDIEAGAFKLVDQQGRVRAALTFNKIAQPGLTLYDENGGTLAFVDGKALAFFSPADRVQVFLDPNTGLYLGDKEGNSTILAASWLFLKGDTLGSADINWLHEKWRQSVELDPSEKGYSRLDSSTGSFLISIGGVKPYADGCKVTVDIGNLTTATYKGFTMHARWGQRYHPTENKGAASGIAGPWEKFQAGQDPWTKWHASLKQKDMSFTDALSPATWNRVELVLPSTKPEDLGYLELSNMGTNRVVMPGLEQSSPGHS
jgi:hypothetical protein